MRRGNDGEEWGRDTRARLSRETLVIIPTTGAETSSIALVATPPPSSAWSITKSTPAPTPAVGTSVIGGDDGWPLVPLWPAQQGCGGVVALPLGSGGLVTFFKAARPHSFKPPTIHAPH